MMIGASSYLFSQRDAEMGADEVRSNVKDGGRRKTEQKGIFEERMEILQLKTDVHNEAIELSFLFWVNEEILLLAWTEATNL